MSKHTPGPWTINYITGVYEVVGGHKSVAECMTEANARLIAAAPELLEALRIAEAALSDIGDADREPGDDVAWCETRAAEAIPTARAAIAKAREAK